MEQIEQIETKTKIERLKNFQKLLNESYQEKNDTEKKLLKLSQEILHWQRIIKEEIELPKEK